MSTIVSFAPSELNFGGVLPGASGPDVATFAGDLPSGAGGVRLAEAPVAASVSFAIAGDKLRFRVRDVFVLAWGMANPEPGPDGPPRGRGTHQPPHRPPPVRALEVGSQSDGQTPVRVEVGQVLLVRVAYDAHDRDGAFAASLTIHGDSWAPINVPLRFFLTEVHTVVLDTLNITQGGQATLPMQVTSLAGPAVDVSYKMSVTQLHNGLSISPNVLPRLQPGETRAFALTFQAATDAPLGSNDVAIDQVTFFRRGFFVRVNVVPARVVVNPAQPNHLRGIRRNSVIPIAVHIGISGGASTNVSFSAPRLPPGLTLQALSTPVSVETTVKLSLAIGAAVSDESDFDIAWTALGGGQSGSMHFHLTMARPITLSGQIASGGVAALGGSYSVTLRPDGSARWQGHAHDSGADGYDYSVSAVIRAPRSGRCVVFSHTGHVGGTFTSGSRDDDWDEEHAATGENNVLSSLFEDFAAANHIDGHVEYTSNIGSALEGMVSWLAKFAVGTLAGPVVGAVIFVGAEAASLFKTGSLVPGARVVEGILWLAGPENTLFALTAEMIASVGSRARELSEEEYNWANGRSVADARTFDGCLPPRDRIVLTDIIGAGDAAFTFPRYDGKIMLNMGSEGYGDPRNYETSKGRRSGEIFVHELVHACQIQHSGQLGLFADSMVSKLEGNAAYLYGPPDEDYTQLNNEQQAQIVQDWFAGNQDKGFGQTGIPQDTNSPYFHYLSDNLRVGKF